MHDRRDPRGGSKNEVRDLINDAEQEKCEHADLDEQELIYE